MSAPRPTLLVRSPTLWIVLLLVVVAAWSSSACASTAPTTTAPSTFAEPTLVPPLDLDPLEPASTGGLATLDRALARLSTHRRLLMIAAHPDDEDTSLLTLVARGEGGESAYLSMSRGDGGQNLIGPETGEALGLLRSRELEAARGIDGARQFFTRAYDFGFTRSLDETFERWPKEHLLEDAMRVVRRFQPQVLVAIFPPTAAAGHGQHQASAVVAREIFDLSRRDDDPFPELTAEGYGPWRIDAFYRAGFFAPEDADVTTDLGLVEPFTGRSMLQIALASRSQHRCQDMGMLQPPGDATGRYIPVVRPTAATDAGGLFAGIDTSVSAAADRLAESTTRRELALELERVESLARSARGELSPRRPGSAVEPLTEIVAALERAIDSLDHASDTDSETGSDAGRRSIRRLLVEKRTIAHEALATAAGLVVDAYTADGSTIRPGEALDVRVEVWSSADRPIDGPTITVLPDPLGEARWTLEADEPAEPAAGRFATRLTAERSLRVVLSTLSTPTVPYHLLTSRKGDLYSWDEVPPAIRGLPFQPPPLRVLVALTVAGTPIELEREVVHRWRDQARGEIREPLRVVPDLEVSIEPQLIVRPLSSTGPEAIHVDMVSRYDIATPLELSWSIGEAWRKDAPIDLVIEPHSRASATIELVPEQPSARGRDFLVVAAKPPVKETSPTTKLQQHVARSYRLVDYEHIRPAVEPRAAFGHIVHVDLELPALERVGWVRGASDELPELLASVGLPIDVFDAALLDEATDADLAAYDAIVVGSRAYEVEPALAAANARLLRYAEAGGLLVVLYQQYQFVGGGFAPYPLDIARPHDRVTDETAPVTPLEPDHPVFHHPNALVVDDWSGWVQERGLYFAGTWDDAYVPLLEMADPGDPPLRGSLLVAPYGDGHYVYTGLAFHRQLPAGVPGAYRLFANLLALGE